MNNGLFGVNDIIIITVVSIVVIIAIIIIAYAIISMSNKKKKMKGEVNNINNNGAQTISPVQEPISSIEPTKLEVSSLPQQKVEEPTLNVEQTVESAPSVKTDTVTETSPIDINVALQPEQSSIESPVVETPKEEPVQMQPTMEEVKLSEETPVVSPTLEAQVKPVVEPSVEVMPQLVNEQAKSPVEIQPIEVPTKVTPVSEVQPAVSENTQLSEEDDSKNIAL